MRTAAASPSASHAAEAGRAAGPMPGEEKPETGGEERWRARLARGDVVEVYSASATAWLVAHVIGISPERVKVEYPVAGMCCDKTLLRSSPHLRQAARGVAVAGGLPASVANVDAVAARSQALAGSAGCSPAAEETVQVASLLQPAEGADAGVPAKPLVFAPDEWLRLADLQLGELIGAGGFGAVHQGRLRGEDVAVKKLHVDGALMSTAQMAEFQKEVANLQALRHPRLIRFIGVALEPPVLCIVTELAAGGSLYALLHTKRAELDPSQRRALALQVIEGVAYLHGRQPPRVHRDIKSANVVLDAALGAKICDFGLTESMEKTHLSRREAEAGSPRYMAPEVFDARSRLSEKLDVWALACLVVEILLSRLPHEDCSTLQQIAVKLLIHFKPPYEDSWSDGFRPELPQVLQPCFRHDPEQRPSSASLLEGLSCMDQWMAQKPT